MLFSSGKSKKNILFFSFYQNEEGKGQKRKDFFRNMRREEKKTSEIFLSSVSFYILWCKKCFIKTLISKAEK